MRLKEKTFFIIAILRSAAYRWSLGKTTGTCDIGNLLDSIQAKVAASKDCLFPRASKSSSELSLRTKLPGAIAGEIGVNYSKRELAAHPTGSYEAMAKLYFGKFFTEFRLQVLENLNFRSSNEHSLSTEIRARHLRTPN